MEAQAHAIMYALQNNISFSDNLLIANKPIMTVFPQKGKWYPAELHPDRITLLTDLAGASLADPSKEKTINLTKAIALSKQRDFIPSFGANFDYSALKKC